MGRQATARSLREIAALRDLLARTAERAAGTAAALTRDRAAACTASEATLGMIGEHWTMLHGAGSLHLEASARWAAAWHAELIEAEHHRRRLATCQDDEADARARWATARARADAAGVTAAIAGRRDAARREGHRLAEAADRHLGAAALSC